MDTVYEELPGMDTNPPLKRIFIGYELKSVENNRYYLEEAITIILPLHRRKRDNIPRIRAWYEYRECIICLLFARVLVWMHINLSKNRGYDVVKGAGYGNYGKIFPAGHQVIHEKHPKTRDVR